MMCEQPLQGGEVFEITDHTTASDWERFIANLEEVLSDWKTADSDERHHDGSSASYRPLPNDFISKGFWHEKRDTVKFSNVVFDIRYQYIDDSSLSTNVDKPHRDDDHDDTTEPSVHNATTDNLSLDSNELDATTRIPTHKEKSYGEFELPENMPECLIDLMATSNDYASKAHCLVRWYNIRRFIILTPRGDTIVTEDKVKLLLSSASIALSNIDLHIPIFVQIHNPKSNFYQGISEHLNIRTMYEMVLFRRNPSQYRYLSESIALFREKISAKLNDPITASVRLNYCLDTFNLFSVAQEEFDGNEHSDDEKDVRPVDRRRESKLRMQDMRSGATYEQVVDALEDCLPHPYKILKYLHVAALWPPVSDTVITDSKVHSDLDPAEAPIWTMRLVTNDNCNMKIVHNTQVIYELFCAAIDYAYDKLDAEQTFSGCNRKGIKEQCLRLSYELSTTPEVKFSDLPTDNLRKIVALMFYRASEIKNEEDALTEIANQLKKKRPALSEIYRNFSRSTQPSVREFIIRTNISRPFIAEATPALPQRMFCTICDDEFRLCGAFSELCN